MEKPEIIVTARSIVSSAEGELLILQRSKRVSNNPRQWEFPGGKLNAGESIEDTQIREIQEETSLIIVPDNSNAYVESSVARKGKYANSTHISITGLAQAIKGRVVLSDEHNDYMWLDPNSEYNVEYDFTRVSLNALWHYGHIDGGVRK
jgi:8-oxo-dGTP diphosphatase